MIVVRLIGGLGNQMFQYAAGRRLSVATNSELFLDLSGFKVYSENPHLDQRRYQLDVFCTEKRVVSQDLVDKVFTERKNKSFFSLFFHGNSSGLVYAKERHFHFDKSILKLKGPAYLDGYWNSEKYFSDISDVIRHDFSFREPAVGKSADILNEILSLESVGIHIRRGDYVSNPKANQVHGTCSREYYLKSVDMISQRISNPHFYVFSDEPEWVRSELRINAPMTIVDHNDPSRGYEDLRLMSNCRHNIIANSTFSWWAAWLNPNPEKIVLAPKEWFRVNKHDTRDLLPAGWICL